MKNLTDENLNTTRIQKINVHKYLFIKEKAK